jgi:hypothetical protein
MRRLTVLWPGVGTYGESAKAAGMKIDAVIAHGTPLVRQRLHCRIATLLFSV